MGPREALRAEFQVGDSAIGGHNNFHLIRLGAALLVLLAHCFHLLGRAGEEPIGRWFVWMDASVLGVATFFFVSGFLVARSWDIRKNLAAFLVARALRIAPALWLALAVTVFGLGAAVTSMPLDEYFRNGDTRQYLLLNAVLYVPVWLDFSSAGSQHLYPVLDAVLYMHYRLPGVFDSNTMPGVNGSLWTIPLEVVLYLILGIAGWIGLLSPVTAGVRAYERMKLHPLLSFVLILIAALLHDRVMRAGAQYYSLAAYFLLGVLCYRFRSMLHWKLGHAILLVAVTLAVANTWAGPLLLPMALACSTLTLALHPLLRMPMTWLHRHDYSYGTYLYGFPVQQTLIALGVREPALLLAYSVPLTLCCAAVSWHLVESPLLKRKGRLVDWIALRISGDP